MVVLQEYSGRLRKALRRWLGIAAMQRQIRDLEGLMAVLPEVERLNAVTTRLAGRFSDLLDQIDALGTGNDDEVRAAAKAEALAQAGAELRPLIDQLDSLGADATAPVPEPAPGQVPVEPGPDVAPVANTDEAAAAGDGGVPQSESQPGVPEAAGTVAEVPGTQIPEGDVTPSSEVPEAQGDVATDEVPGTNG